MTSHCRVPLEQCASNFSNTVLVDSNSVQVTAMIGPMARETLTREQVVQAALELLDTEGLAGLSMRRLGAKLGSGATSVYWHVKNKDEMIALAADEVIGGIELPEPAAAGWREAASTTAAGMRDVIARHPWLLEVLVSNPRAYGPGMARFADHSLAVFESAGFAGPDIDQAAAAVFSYVFGTTMGEVGESTMRAKLRRDGVDEEAFFTELTEHAREIAAPFPRLVARFDNPALYAGPEEARDQSFDFGLQAVLDGLAARLT